MSGLQFVSNAGNAIQASAGGTIAVALTVAVPAYGVLVARATTFNGAAATGATDRHASIADPGAHLWTKLVEVSNTDGSTGVTESLWLAEIDGGLAAGQVVTLTLDASRPGRIMALELYDKGGASQAVLLVAATGAFGESTSPSVGLTPTDPGLYTWIGAGGHTAGQVTVTVNSSWTTDRAKLVANGGTHANNTSLWGQFRELDAASATWTATLSGSRRWVMLLAACTVTERIRELPSALVADTFYGRPILLDEPNWLSPVSRGVSTALHPVGGAPGLWDARLATLATTARVSLEGHFSIFGRDQIGLWRAFLDRIAGRRTAFWCPTWTAEAMLTAEATTGQPDLTVAAGHVVEAGDWVAVRRLNDSLVCGQVEALGGGTILTLAADLPVTIPQPISRVSRLLLVRLEDDEVGLSFLAHDIAEVTLRMVTVPPSELAAFDVDVPLGDPDWQDSERPPVLMPPVLQRPSFPGPIFDIVWYRGQLWRSGTGVPVNYGLMVSLPEAVDAVELQCADVFPAGFQDDEFIPGSGRAFIWDKQVQEIVGPYSAGATPSFWPIAITHSAGTSLADPLGSMTPCSFRVRTRKSIDGDVCYSPWRYFLAIPEPKDFGQDTDIGYCGRESIICANMPGDWFLGPIPPGTFGPPCPDPGPVHPGGFNCQLIEARWSQPGTGPFAYHASYQFLGRGVLPLDFSDRHMRFLGVARSKVSFGVAGGTIYPGPDLSGVNQDQTPLQIPDF